MGVSMSGKYRTLKPGDQINVSVTNDFASVANEFYDICEEYHFNPSEVIRSSVSMWLEMMNDMIDTYESSKRSKEMKDSFKEKYEKSVFSKFG